MTSKVIDYFKGRERILTRRRNERENKTGIERRINREGRDNYRRIGFALLLGTLAGTAGVIYGIDKLVDYLN
jgi:hypothetical protein